MLLVVSILRGGLLGVEGSSSSCNGKNRRSHHHQHTLVVYAAVRCRCRHANAAAAAFVLRATLAKHAAAPIRVLFYATWRAGVWRLIGALSQSLLHKQHPLACLAPCSFHFWRPQGQVHGLSNGGKTGKEWQQPSGCCARTHFYMLAACTANAR